MDSYSFILSSLNLELRPELFALMAVYFVLMYLVYAAVYGMIGAISGSAQEGSQYAGFLILPTMIPFYFMPILQNDPNGLTATITILARTVIAGVPLWQTILSVVLLFVLAIASMWMAGRVFRVQTLLSGTKLKMSDIPRLIFAKD